MAALGPCRAAIPLQSGWRECGEDATVEYEYRCVQGHVKRRATCPAHEPVPGDVGCRECFDIGTDRPMTWAPVA